MSEPSKLAEALAQVQAELPTLERDRTVEVQQKGGGSYTYSYVTLAKLSEAVFPLLAKNGLSFTSMPGLGSDGKMCVRYRLLHISGEFLEGEFPISGDGSIQRLGGMITYVRRYCLAAVVGIAADEDDESRLADTGPATAQRAPQGQRAQRQQTARRTSAPPPLPGEDGPSDPITNPQLQKMHAIFNGIGWTDRDDRLRALSAMTRRPIGSGSDLTKAEASELIETLHELSAEPDPSARLAELLDALAAGGES